MNDAAHPFLLSVANGFMARVVVGNALVLIVFISRYERSIFCDLGSNEFVQFCAGRLLYGADF